MIGSAAHETEILTQILALRDDPVGFVHYAIPWGRAGTPFADVSGPRPWQLEELESIGAATRAQRFACDNQIDPEVYKAAFASGRGPGKSAMFGMVALWHASTHLGAPTLVAANTESQLRITTFPEFSKWFGSAINAHWWVVDGMRISPQPWLAELVSLPPERGGLSIDPKYWYVQGRTWSEENPEAFVGPHGQLLMLFDEASGIHSSIWERAEGFFTETVPYRFWLAASQMRNRTGRFFEIFNDAKMGQGWHTRVLSTRGMPGLNQATIEDQIRRYGEDSDFVRVEILGLAPRTSEDQFIPWDNVRQAQQNQLGYDDGEPLILGVDPAPRGKTAWRFRSGRDARSVCGRDTHGHWLGKDNVQIAQAIMDLDAKYKPEAICIDFGMGTGVIDILKRKRLNGRVHEVKFGDSPHGGKDNEWGSHSIELWALMRDWLPGGMIEVDDGEKGTLSQQLTDRGWRWSGREEGKKILETKEDLQKRGVKSPDDADALACTFEVRPPRRDNGRFPGGGQYVAQGVEKHPFFD